MPYRNGSTPVIAPPTSNVPGQNVGGGYREGGPVQVFLDGRMIAESTVPHIPSVVQQYGLG